MVAGRGFVLLVVQKFAQGGFLLGAALQHQEHALHGERGRGCAQVELTARKGMGVALEDGQLLLVERFGDERAQADGRFCCGPGSWADDRAQKTANEESETENGFGAEERRDFMGSTPPPWDGALLGETDGPGEGSPTALAAREVRPASGTSIFT